MAGFFSSFKTFLEKNTNATVLSSNIETGYNKFLKTSFISGYLLVLTLLLLITAFLYNQKQAQQNTAKIEITARLQVQVHHLTSALQHIFTHQTDAFAQFEANHKNINRYITLLSDGGNFRQTEISAITQPHLYTSLNHLEQIWQSEEKKIRLILDHSQTLTNMSKTVDSINDTSNDLYQKIGQLIDRLTETGGSPDAFGAAATMRLLTQNVTRSINVILSSKLPVPEINKQLAHDRKQFSAILQAFNQGHDFFGLSAINDREAQQLLPQIQSLLIKIDNIINTIQTEISNIMIVRTAANEIIQNGDKMLDSIVTLDEVLQMEGADMIGLLTKIQYGLILATVLTLGLLMFSLHQYRSTRKHVVVGQQVKVRVHDQPPIDARTMQNTQKAMLTLLDDMKKMAEGDLTVRTTVTEDITGAVADAVNFTIEELQALVKQVNHAGAQVVNASTHAQQVSTKLLSAAQHQSLKIEETTVAVLSMADSINQVSDTAAQSTEVAKQSLLTAEKGGIAVRESIAGMEEIRVHIQETSKRIKRLGESSQEIGEIIALVSDITEQTNILALNAALQATAAGEAGRGFNKIAQEVQRLAERSAEASKQISRLIKMIQNDTYDTIAAMERSTREVIKGAQKSNFAGNALEEIETVSKRLADHVTHIYTTSLAHTQSAKQVIENMEEILHITRQTTNGTRQTTASIEQISNFTSELKASVSNFKI